MKILIIAIVVVIVSLFAENKMIIHKSNGVKDTLDVVNDIDSITFFTANDHKDTVVIPTYGNMKLIYARDSSFIMGSNSGSSYQSPAHLVKFTRDFWMDSTEVTQQSFDTLMKLYYPNYSTPNWGGYTGDNYPAHSINWYSAALYCNARSKYEEKDTVYIYSTIKGTPGDGCSLTYIQINYESNGYRLPTEAEWEYSCRARSTSDYFWGDEPDEEYAWINISGFRKVAEKRANQFGLYDMSGNAMEWCNDWAGKYESNGQVEIDPYGIESPTNSKIIRSGNRLESAYRFSSEPDSTYYNPSLRVVLSIDPYSSLEK